MTVTEPEPKVELVWNTTKKLYEDDYLVVELRAKNIPNYYKGLFTLSFDPAILSFRSAEKGDFFPADYRASIFYAQPPMNPGKVTIAISADEVGLPKGDGVVSRAIFKLKEDVQDPTTLDVRQMTDAEARYILNAEGSNILPQTTDKPLFATDWIDPPPAPTQSRTQQQPAADMPSTPTPPTTSSPRTGGSSAAPSTGQPVMQQPESTYIPPSAGGFDRGPAPIQPGAVAPPPEEGSGNPELDDLHRQLDEVTNDQSISEEDRAQRIQELLEQIRLLEGGSSR